MPTDRSPKTTGTVSHSQVLSSSEPTNSGTDYFHLHSKGAKMTSPLIKSFLDGNRKMTVSKCAFMCASRDCCKAFSYSAKRQVCSLHQRGPEDAVSTTEQDEDYNLWAASGIIEPTITTTTTMAPPT